MWLKGLACKSALLQQEPLQAAGCADIVQEKPSSSRDRPQLQILLTRLRAGDTLVVWKLDRLGRSLKDLVLLVTGSQYGVRAELPGQVLGVTDFARTLPAGDVRQPGTQKAMV